MSFSLLSKEIINSVAYNLLGEKKLLLVRSKKKYWIIFGEIE